MAIILPSGFVITNNEPVDSRLSVANSASRFSLSVNNVYEGITVYERDTNIIYVLTDATAPSSASSWQSLISNTSSSIATSASYSTTSSYTLSGNGLFSGSFSGSFQGNGSGLTDIPASGIVGLNLSQIASGSATASISPVSGFRVNTNSVFTGSTTNELVRITQTGPGLAFVVEDSTNPDSTRFAIDTSGSVSIGTFIPLSGSNLDDNVKLQSTVTGKIYSAGVAGTSDGTGINGQSVGVLGRAIGNLGYNYGGQFIAENGRGYNFGIISYANGDSVNTIESVGGEFQAAGGLGTLGIRAQATGDGIYTLQSMGGYFSANSGINGNTGINVQAIGDGSSTISIGGIFDANNSISNYSIQLIDGTEGVNKVLVSQTADGKANWSNDLNITTVTASFRGNLTGTASYAATASVAPAYLPLTGGTISGNLTVIGTASFVYTTSSIVNVGNSTVLVNTNYPAVRFGGISVVDSGSFGNSSTGSLLWDSLMNRWIYSNPSGSTYDGGILIAGPKNTSGLGNESGMTENFVAVGQGTDHIQPGTIFNSGSITQVTGSLTVTAGVTGSFTGSYVGSGDGLYNIPASGITGLNLSQISSGSVSASISPDLGLQINTDTTITGSLTITPPGSGNIFVVRSLSTPAGSFTIDANGRIGIGAAPNSTYRLNVSSNTSIIGIYGYASFAGIFGVSDNQGVRGAGTIGVYGEADGKDYGVGVSGFAKDDSAIGSILNIGGKFSATGAIDNHAVQLQDGTEGINKILVSTTADGKANWSNTINVTSVTSSFTGSLVGSLTGTASYATTSSYYAETDPIFVSVSGSLVTTASFNAFTSSYNTGSFTGSFTGNGAGLTNIPAAGIVGLNLSQISSGSVSASISPATGLQINTNVTATSFTGSFSGSGAGLYDIFPVTTNAQILVSTGSVLAARSVTGDIAITNAGVTTIQTGAVTFSKIQTLSQAALIGATGSLGGVVQEIPIIEAYVPTGSAFTSLLENTANWDINGVYIGSAITGTYQGQSHLNNDYWFTAVADNNWIRLIRG